VSTPGRKRGRKRTKKKKGGKEPNPERKIAVNRQRAIRKRKGAIDLEGNMGSHPGGLGKLLGGKFQILFRSLTRRRPLG